VEEVLYAVGECTSVEHELWFNFAQQRGSLTYPADATNLESLWMICLVSRLSTPWSIGTVVRKQSSAKVSGQWVMEGAKVGPYTKAAIAQELLRRLTNRCLDFVRLQTRE